MMVRSIGMRVDTHASVLIVSHPISARCTSAISVKLRAISCLKEDYAGNASKGT